MNFYCQPLYNNWGKYATKILFYRPRPLFKSNATEFIFQIQNNQFSVSIKVETMNVKIWIIFLA